MMDLMHQEAMLERIRNKVLEFGGSNWKASDWREAILSLLDDEIQAVEEEMGRVEKDMEERHARGEM